MGWGPARPQPRRWPWRIIPAADQAASENLDQILQSIKSHATPRDESNEERLNAAERAPRQGRPFLFRDRERAIPCSVRRSTLPLQGAIVGKDASSVKRGLILDNARTEMETRQPRSASVFAAILDQDHDGDVDLDDLAGLFTRKPR